MGRYSEKWLLMGHHQRVFILTSMAQPTTLPVCGATLPCSLFSWGDLKPYTPPASASRVLDLAGSVLYCHDWQWGRSANPPCHTTASLWLQCSLHKSHKFSPITFLLETWSHAQSIDVRNKISVLFSVRGLVLTYDPAHTWRTSPQSGIQELNSG